MCYFYSQVPQGFYHEGVLKICQRPFLHLFEMVVRFLSLHVICTCWAADLHMLGSLPSVNETNLAMVYDLLNVLLNSIFRYLTGDFYVYW